MTKKPIISIKNVFLMAIITLICFISIKILMRNVLPFNTVYGNIFPLIINILVVIALFYATIRSADSGRRVQMAWMFMTLAFVFFTAGNILELGIHLKPWAFLPNIFYLIFYPLFSIGIYFLPTFSFTRNERIKIFLDMGIIIVTLGLIFWVFLIVPTLSVEHNSFTSNIPLIYIIGYLLLFFVLLRGIYSKFDDYYVPVLLLSLGILAMIITDSVYAFQTVNGAYISGGLLEIGWVVSFMFVGLAAFLQGSKQKVDLKNYSSFTEWIEKSNLIYYIPFFWVFIAFIILVWYNDNLFVVDYYDSVEVFVGFIVFLVIIRQFITLKENKNLLAKAEIEVESRKLAEARAHENEMYYKAIFENTGTSIIIVDPDMTISRVNSEVESITGYTKDEMEGRKKWTDFVVEEDLVRITGYFNLRHDSNKRPREYETQIRDKYGNIKDVLVTVVNIPVTKKLLASFIDVTKRKNTENQIKSSLNEKSILLQEIHHRVKNNMQIISSLLNLQTRYVNDQKAIDVLKESQNRVKSMAMIHEKLYLSKDLSHIDFGDYIKSLVTNLFYSYNIEKTHIKPVLQVENLNLNIDTAVPCGLIISELVSNSLKYAFPPGMNGEIFVSLKFVNNKYELIIRDNGLGMSDDIDFNNLQTLGLLLVNNLTEQLDGEMTINRKKGTEFGIIFKEIKYKNRM
jgi:PAS domain S-box-containing protein